jgi:DNA helicase IV
MQDIFNREVTIPTESSFFKYSLTENCRNTKKIVQFLEKTINSPIPVGNNPEGDDVIVRRTKNSIELQTQLINDILELTRNQKIKPEQLLIILNSFIEQSSIATLTKVGSLPLKALDNKARFDASTIHFTYINTFKGLECDIVLVIDTHLIAQADHKKILYTQASRAKHKLFVYEAVKT